MLDGAGRQAPPTPMEMIHFVPSRRWTILRRERGSPGAGYSSVRAALGHMTHEQEGGSLSRLFFLVINLQDKV